MKIVRILFAVMVVTVGLFAQEIAQDQQAPQKILRQAPVFGFGVKLGQAPDSRETDGAFKTLLAQPDAKQQFVEVFEKGNLNGKCYALCALNQLDPELFEGLAKRMDGKQIVRIRDGCCEGESTVKDLLKSIVDGRYREVAK